MKHVLVLAFYLSLILVDDASAQAIPCCPNGQLMHKARCKDGEKNLTCDNGYFLLRKNDEEEEPFSTQPDGTLKLGSEVIAEREEYCVGEMIFDGEKTGVALVCFPEIQEATNIGAIATTICSFLSVAFLLLTLIVYLILPELRDLQGKCLIFFISSLMLSFTFLGTVHVAHKEISESNAACIAIACLIYFWFLCSFFWMNVVSFNFLRTVVNFKSWFEKKNLFLIYNIYGWGMPTIFLIAVLITDFTPGNHIKANFGVVSCWFRGTTELWTFFYGPILIIILTNVVMFIITAFALSDKEKNCPQPKLRSQKFKFLLYLKLFVVMGVCWLFEPLSNILVVKGVYLWIVTDYINALQGIIIFLLLIVFRKRVRKGLAQTVRWLRLPQTWAAMRDEDCEELDESNDQASSMLEEGQNSN